MTEEIQFTKYNASNHDLACKKGEIRNPTGMTFCDDGSLAMASLHTTPIAQMPEDMTPMYAHKGAAHTNIIATDGNAIYWAAISDEYRLIPRNAFTKIIDVTTHIHDAVLMNGVIVVATDEGILYINQTDTGYKCTRNIMSPRIDFGLQKAGNLSNPITITIPSSSIESANGIFPNTTKISSTINTSEISEAVANIFDEAVVSQITTKGYFHMPFFIRYALRLYNGSHIMPSTPILMLPTTLPPCIGLTITDDTDNNVTHISASLTKVIYHQLRYRIKYADIESLKPLVAAIDIFVTPMIPTYDTSRINQGYVTTYNQVLNAGLSPIRGRLPTTTDKESLVYDGHYSTSADNYIDHYLEQSVRNTTALMLYPNTDIHNQIIRASEYRLIASIPINDVTESDNFMPVPLTPTSDRNVSTYKLDNDLSNIFDICASTLCQINGHLLATVKSLLPKPGILPFSTPYYGDSTSQPNIYTEIAIHLKIDNQEYTFNYSNHFNHYLSEHLPRYIYIPHRGAYRISIRQGTELYDLNLSPHPTLNGSFWYGGLDNVTVPSIDISGYNATENLQKRNSSSVPVEMILVTAKDNVYVFDEAQTMTLEEASLTKIIEATKSPKYGTFGKYPAYVFTSSGIWMLEYSYTQQKFISHYKICRDRCISPNAITATDNSVLYATDTQIISLDGSDTQTISMPLTAMNWDINTLPHCNELLNLGRMEQIETSLQELIENGILLFDFSSSTLLLTPKESDYTLAYHNDAWSTVSLKVKNVVKSNTSQLYLIHPDHSISVLGNNASDNNPPREKAFIVTRPIRTEKRIRSIKILGNFAEGNVAAAIYGATTYGKWHLCASSVNHYAQIHSSEPYHLYIMAIIANMDDYEYITGAAIEYAE